MKYQPQPFDTTAVEMPPELQPLVERLAANSHAVWAAQRIRDGWTYGPVRDDANRRHPCLVSYEELPEAEKEYDRQSVRQTLKVILAMGYRISRNSGS
jgi:ryanodine receptor 2